MIAGVFVWFNVRAGDAAAPAWNGWERDGAGAKQEGAGRKEGWKW